ncbi:hypothetical protein HUT18_07110 [Streptomyces sp. NA04227]|nr:hypothetical protein HUT18_07110 [Streptomyces sp. NA04227]
MRGVLQKSGEAAEGLGKVGTQLQKTFPEAAKHAGTAIAGGELKPGTPGLVGSALGVFVRQWQKNLAYVAERTEASLKGAALATTEYHRGNLTMAAKAQEEALKVPEIDLPGVHGGQGGQGGGGR